MRCFDLEFLESGVVGMEESRGFGEAGKWGTLHTVHRDKVCRDMGMLGCMDAGMKSCVDKES